MKNCFAVSLLGAVLFLAGCESTGPRHPSSWVPTGDPLMDGRTALNQGPPRDRVLWQYRMAASAIRRGQYAEAKSVLDDVLVTLGGIRQPDKNARKSRGYFHEESKKTFVGEPYERVMAYYYRGILYWMDGEPDNARACFRSAALEDSAENNEYRSDYVLLDYLDGYVTLKLSKDGSDAFKRAQAESRLSKPPLYDIKANTMVFAEFGHGPTKYATGEYGEQLRFREGSSVARAVRIRAENQTVEAGAYDDLTFQATTRGGRVMDYVLQNKAVFKSGTDIGGDVALLGGIVAASNRGTRDIGLGLVAAGVLSKLMSAATTPAADVRSWDNLPQYLSFASLNLPPGAHVLKVDFLDAAGRPLPNRTQTISVQVPSDGRDAVVFVSDQT